MSVSISTTLEALKDTKTSLNHLEELLRNLTLHTTSWRWLYEETDKFSQTTKNCQELITDLRDWYDLTCTDRSEFNELEKRLLESSSGTILRLSIKRIGRKVEIKDVSPEYKADICIHIE